MSQQENVTVLKNPPLKEVIFELHWELEFIADQNIKIDSHFEEAVLKFSNSCQQGFKEIEILKPTSIPYTAFNHKITHRFFREKGQHPLYQLGPGVFTVNDNNKNYNWGEFEKLLKNGIGCIRNSYPKPLVLGKVELRYFDAVPITCLGDTDKFEFLKKHLKVNAEGWQFVEQGTLEDINFSKRFSIDESTYLIMTIATGFEQKTREDSIIWQTYVNNKRALTWDELPLWTEKAHRICSDTFKKMLSDDLLKYFR